MRRVLFFWTMVCMHAKARRPNGVLPKRPRRVASTPTHVTQMSDSQFFVAQMSDVPDIWQPLSAKLFWSFLCMLLVLTFVQGHLRFAHCTLFACICFFLFASALSSLQCFDAVGLVAGRTSGLWKLSGEVLAWSSVWSEVQMICIWSSWCHCRPIISCSTKIQMVYLSGAGLLRVSWKKAVKRM